MPLTVEWVWISEMLKFWKLCIFELMKYGIAKNVLPWFIGLLKEKLGKSPFVTMNR